MMMRSPVQPVFENSAGSIPFAFREQFLLSPEDPHEILLHGEMQLIWHPAALRPLFWILGKFGMLVPIRARHVPTTLHVIPGRTADGAPFHEWNRTFSLARPVRFNTTIVWDRHHNNLADLVGTPRLLRMVWAARYMPPDTFTLDSIANALTIGPWTLWLPRWLWRCLLGSVEFRQVASREDENQVSVDLRIVHPVLRTVFRYHGVFRTRRVPRSVSIAPVVSA